VSVQAPTASLPRTLPERVRGTLRRQALAPLLTLVAVAGAYVIHAQAAPGPAAPVKVGPMPRSTAMELRYGVRFSSVAVTAGGGMLDLRYVVEDAQKARDLGHTRATAPVLVDDRSGRVLSGLFMSMFPHDPVAGYQYYLLYRNDGATLHRGSTVSIRIGNSWLRGVMVR